MNESLFSLEEWTAKVSASAKGNVRAVLARFQRHWYDGHVQNPLLFPMEQTHQAWKAHFEWFLTVEKFKLPDRQPEKRLETETSRAGLTAPPPSESAETVFFNVDNYDRGGKTVIYDPPGTESAETGELDELSDLGTLIVESREKETGTVIIDDSPQAGVPAVDKTGKRSRDVEAAADKTILIDQPMVSGAGAADSQAEQTVLIDRPYALEREVSQAETVIYGPREAAGESAASPDQGTIISEVGPKPDVDKETIIIDPGTVSVDRKSPTSAGTHPFPEQARALRKEKKKEAVAGPSPDVDLDLDDLDTMVWLEEDEKPEK